MARETNDGLVDGTWRDICDRLHVEAGPTQGANDAEVTALVGEEPHAARVTRSRAARG